MITVEEQLRRYAVAHVEAAAIGPDPSEPASDAVEHRSHGGRWLLVAALLLLVGAAGFTVTRVVDRQGRSEPVAGPASVTTVGGDDQLAVTLTVERAEAAFGSSITAEAQITNVSTGPVTVWATAAPALQLTWSEPTASDPAAQQGTRMLFSQYSFVVFQPVDGPVDPTRNYETTRLRPGETLRYEGRLDLDTRVRTGPVQVAVAPRAGLIGAPGSVPAQPAKVLSVTADLTVTGSPSIVASAPDAAAAALADARIEEFVSGMDRATGGGGWTGGVSRTGTGWRMRWGPGRTSQGADVDSALQASGGPGFIADISPDGVVTIVWMVLP